VDFIGTGDSGIGVSFALKQRFPDIRCFGVEPENAPQYAGDRGRSGKHSIQGGGYYMTLPFVEHDGRVLDGFITVTDEAAAGAARRLARAGFRDPVPEYLFVGIRSPAVSLKWNRVGRPLPDIATGTYFYFPVEGYSTFCMPRTIISLKR
jgi:cysteine synthase